VTNFTDTADGDRSSPSCNVQLGGWSFETVLGTDSDSWSQGMDSAGTLSPRGIGDPGVDTLASHASASRHAAWVLTEGSLPSPHHDDVPGAVARLPGTCRRHVERPQLPASHDGTDGGRRGRGCRLVASANAKARGSRGPKSGGVHPPGSAGERRDLPSEAGDGLLGRAHSRSKSAWVAAKVLIRTRLILVPKTEIMRHVVGDKFGKSKSNQGTQKAGIQLLLTDLRFQIPNLATKRRILELIGASEKFGAQTFDAVMTPEPEPPITVESVAGLFAELRLIEMKTTMKPIQDDSLHAFFFGATEREYDMARTLGDRYLFAFVVLNSFNAYKRPFAVLLTLDEVERRTMNKRLQYQVNFRTDLTAVGGAGEGWLVLFGDESDIPPAL
jgi:hypothetical protein